MNILVTGANGFVGQHLVQKLSEDGHQVFALVRDLSKKKSLDGVEWIEGDLLKPLPSLKNKIKKIDCAYYLVHGLESDKKNFEYFEALMATHFIQWVKPFKPLVVYLGALGPRLERLSPHLRSRHLTGEILGISGLAVLELRASIILGAGSLSFEMIKALAERLPFLPQMPRLENPCSPLSQKDLIHYLLLALKLQIQGHKIIEIGSQTSSYGDLLKVYGQQVGTKKVSLPLPDLDERVLASMLDMIVPEYSQIGKKLMESLIHPTIVEDHSADLFFPDFRPLGPEESMRTAILESSTYYAPIWKKDFYDILFSKTFENDGVVLRNIYKKYAQHFKSVIQLNFKKNSTLLD